MTAPGSNVQDGGAKSGAAAHRASEKTGELPLEGAASPRAVGPSVAANNPSAAAPHPAFNSPPVTTSSPLAATHGRSLTTGNGLRVGVYVDVANIEICGGYGMRYDVLREFACRGGGEPLRLNAYVAVDENSDADRKRNRNNYFSLLRSIGFKVIEKPIHTYQDSEGHVVRKGNVDMDIALDVIQQCEKLDKVVLASGDGDFVPLVRAVQNKGCRVEVIAFRNVSGDLRREADAFTSGYLVPNLLPIEANRERRALWGEPGSRVRGQCHRYIADKGIGFFQVLVDFHREMWILDSEDPASAYIEAFFRASWLPAEIHPGGLPSRALDFEFELALSESGRLLEAREITLMKWGASPLGVVPAPTAAASATAPPPER